MELGSLGIWKVMFSDSAVTKQPEHKMADQGKPRSASHKISDAQVKVCTYLAGFFCQ